MSGREGRPAGGLGRRLTSYTRFVIGVPVLGLFAGAVTLVLVSAVEVGRTIVRVAGGTLDKKAAMVEFIELADAFLLATVLYVMAMGLYELFIDDRIPLPRWLEIHDLDDLKVKLVGVVVVVMGVLFLGSVVSADSAQELALRGIGIAAVIAALTFFVSKGSAHGGGKGDER